MKMDQRKELHSMSIEDLRKELAAAERQLLDYRFDAGLNKLTNPAGLRNTRKRIATLKTLLRQHELLTEHSFTSMDEYKAYKVAERKAFRESRRSR